MSHAQHRRSLRQHLADRHRPGRNHSDRHDDGPARQQPQPRMRIVSTPMPVLTCPPPMARLRVGELTSRAPGLVPPRTVQP